MFRNISRIVVLLFLTSQQTEAFFGGSFAPDLRGLGEVLEKIEKYEEQRRKELDDANHFSDEDYNRILNNKKSELRSANAILTRYKDDFAQVRDRDDQDGRYTKHKVREIFKSEIYRYHPTRDLKPLVEYLFSDLRDSTTNKEEKLSHLENKITNLNKALIYMRNLVLKKGDTPFRIFVYLYHVDIALAIHKSQCEVSKMRDSCEWYHKILAELQIE